MGRGFQNSGDAARGRSGVGVGTESTTEPLEEKVEGTGEAGGTGVEEEAEKDWEGKRTGVEGGSCGVTTAL